jgi:hypothetical protein
MLKPEKVNEKTCRILWFCIFCSHFSWCIFLDQFLGIEFSPMNENSDKLFQGHFRYVTSNIIGFLNNSLD